MFTGGITFLNRKKAEEMRENELVLRSKRREYFLDQCKAHNIECYISAMTNTVRVSKERKDIYRIISLEDIYELSDTQLEEFIVDVKKELEQAFLLHVYKITQEDLQETTRMLEAKTRDFDRLLKENDRLNNQLTEAQKANAKLFLYGMYGKYPNHVYQKYEKLCRQSEAKEREIGELHETIDAVNQLIEKYTQ